MMMYLPESMHIEYSHLVSTPRFLLEQLIMNMKVGMLLTEDHILNTETMSHILTY